MTNKEKNMTSTIKPSKGLLKRIDIGLITGVCAVLISLFALVIGKQEIEIALQAHKATILPIIDIDMGYVTKQNGSGGKMPHYEVKLSNVGAGIAHIQKVVVKQYDKPLITYKAFEEAVMTKRMRSWASVTEAPAGGYLLSGENVVPISYRLGAAESDLPAYLRGEWGTPMDQVDLSICYCSVLEDCWTVNYLDRKLPKPVSNCGIGDVVQDDFQNFIDQRFKVRNKK